MPVGLLLLKKYKKYRLKKIDKIKITGLSDNNNDQISLWVWKKKFSKRSSVNKIKNEITY